MVWLLGRSFGGVLFCGVGRFLVNSAMGVLPFMYFWVVLTFNVCFISVVFLVFVCF